MMRRLYCWLNGHDYVFALGNRMGDRYLLSITVCVRCGARHITAAVMEKVS